MEFGRPPDSVSAGTPGAVYARPHTDPADSHPSHHEGQLAMADSTTNRKIAVVHDFLYTYAGAERVLEQILNVYPDAELFSLFDFLPPEKRDFIRHKKVHSSFLQRLPMAKRKHRQYLPLMPLAIEQLDMSAYDLVISSSYVAAKGVITRPDQLHVCYCHSPVRFAWDLQHQYLNESGLTAGLKSILARAILHYIRTWDLRTANGVDAFLSNSQFVARRIHKVYRRTATPVYPPVDVDSFTLRHNKQDFYLTASRMVPYKRIDLIVEALTKMPDRRLVVIGDGPDLAKIKQIAGPNVKLLGFQPNEILKDYMQRAKAFVFAAEEDFGIVAVEAQACGTPVLAYGRGGVTEIIINGETGLFFGEQTTRSLIEAVTDFETSEIDWDPPTIRANAERFSAARFRTQFQTVVEAEWQQFRAARTRVAPPTIEAMPSPVMIDLPPRTKAAAPPPPPLVGAGRR
ncbi:MAG: glycosyltransferase family 4 protein [Tepidisphaeraceae bacterium]